MKTYVTEISGKWYAFAGDTTKDQVLSIGADRPPLLSGGSFYIARWTDSGIRYVASPSPNRKAAIAKAKRHGEFHGTV